MSEFAKGDYVVYTDEFGDGHYGRVAFVDEHGMVHVCFTSGCITRPRKPEWLRKIELRPWLVQVRFGHHRFDADCPDYDPDRCTACCPEKGGRVAMRRYCEGVLGSAMIDNSSFTVRVMPIEGRLSIDHEHGGCCLDDTYDYCSIPIDYCPKCGRDLWEVPHA